MPEAQRQLTPLVKVLLIGGILLLGAAGAVGVYFASERAPKLPPLKSAVSPAQEDRYVIFLLEVYDKIRENYWEKVDEAKLASLFGLAIDKLQEGQASGLAPQSRQELQGILENEMSGLDLASQKQDFAVKLADLVLLNLEPFGRSRLYSQKQEKELKEQIHNINPEVQPYQVLGVAETASQEEIAEAYREETKNLQNDKSPEAEAKLRKLEQAYLTLSDPALRKSYDETGAQATVEGKLLRPDVFYIRLDRFSPTLLQELNNLASKVDQGEVLNTLILDLRDNIGGLIDGLTYFLGPFIGNDQYAYQFYHQGQKKDFKTVIGWLPSLLRYKRVVILINENTQSSAEVMAATLKKYNVGVLVGTKTKGWGTVEQVFELKNQIAEDQKFSVFLVHELTLREDGQPIEGRGVEPLVNINDANWEKQLFSYFHYPELVQVVKTLVKK